MPAPVKGFVFALEYSGGRGRIFAGRGLREVVTRFSEGGRPVPALSCHLLSQQPPLKMDAYLHHHTYNDHRHDCQEKLRVVVCRIEPPGEAAFAALPVVVLGVCQEVAEGHLSAPVALAIAADIKASTSFRRASDRASPS